MPAGDLLIRRQPCIPLRGVSQNLHSYALFHNALALCIGMHVPSGCWFMLQVPSNPKWWTPDGVLLEKRQWAMIRPIATSCSGELSSYITLQDAWTSMTNMPMFGSSSRQNRVIRKGLANLLLCWVIAPHSTVLWGLLHLVWVKDSVGIHTQIYAFTVLAIWI